MTLPLPIRTAGDTATEHVDDHNEIHGILGGGLPTGLTTSSTGHLANHNTIHTTLNSTRGQSLPTGIAAGATGHLSHHNTIHTLLNETAAVVYGPTNGAQSVRDAAGPRTVTNPGGGIAFSSSSDLQTKINANSAGSTFVCDNNSPTWNSTVATAAKHPMIVFPGAPGACVIDGGGAERTAVTAGDGTTIKGGTFRNFGTSTAGRGVIAQSNCVIEDVIYTDCFVIGIAVQGLNTTVSHCTMHTNGGKGFGTGNLAAGETDGLIVEYCDIYNNNTRNLDGGDDASGSKIFVTKDGIFRNNWVHDNNGFGMWWDTGNYDWVIEENVAEDNAFSGLFYEASFGSVIRHNYLADNGKNHAVGATGVTFMTQVQARLTDDNCNLGTAVRGEFSRNRLDFTTAQSSTQGGLLLLWDQNATTNRSLQDWDVMENQFWLRGTVTQRVGGQDTASAAFPVWSSGNSFFDNQYQVASTSVSYWKWDSGTGSGVAKNYTQWQGYHPGEGGSLTVI